MSNPLVHAERSARKWRGRPEDYLPLHQWFDSTKGHLADNRHRVVLHNSFGILLAEQVFGPALVNSDGRRVFVRELGQQHVLEDLGFIPSLAETDAIFVLILRPSSLPQVAHAVDKLPLPVGLLIPPATRSGLIHSRNCRSGPGWPGPAKDSRPNQLSTGNRQRRHLHRRSCAPLFHLLEETITNSK